MTERPCVIVFDWGWNYLGHEFLMISAEDMYRLPLDKVDAYNLEVTRRVAPGKPDVHTVMCLVDEDGDLDVERATREVIKLYRRGDYASHTKSWVGADGEIVAHKVVKGRPN